MKSFATRLLAWWRQHGRHDLPWQQPRDPYRVWVAEVMLQQTQVATVIPYFERFMARFPRLTDLATAAEDDVLALWSGLGYYSRALNLHRTARLCLTGHRAALPTDAEILATLPGIGPSTANAIIAQAHDQVLPILDGNVKRVMARHAGIEGWPGTSAVQKQLWQAAEDRLPESHGTDYTQAIMDLGATICIPRRPLCQQCPVIDDCQAHKEEKTTELPTRKPRKKLPEKSACFALVLNSNQEIWLERRPGQGIWNSLWCLPQFDDSTQLQEWVAAQLRDSPENTTWTKFHHTFTHFKLHAEVVQIQAGLNCPLGETAIGESHASWFNLAQALEKGLPQPIRQVLQQLAATITG